MVRGHHYFGLAMMWWLAITVTSHAQEEATGFYRGLNLNGAAVVIDGHAWEGQDSTTYECNDQAFENQDVSLVPPTDGERAKMIRSSRWGGNEVVLTGIPSGRFSVFLYVWEDNSPETFRISVNGREVVSRYQSGPAGHWEKLGPWFVDVRDGKIRITSQGGAANFSGIELWSGEYDVSAADLTADNIEFFEKRIRPLLVTRCYECHSAESKDAQGDLLVDSRIAIRKGGGNGPAIVPRDMDRSLLIKAVRYSTDGLQMPPDEKLPETEIAALEEWVKRGAPDPRNVATKIQRKRTNLDEARKFWSYQAIAKPPLPKLNQAIGPVTEIDQFILAELEKRGLQPLPLADKRTLIRRATFDLIGLPPTPDEIDAFLADDSPSAFDSVVNRLLDSTHYGERWGRHWLDVVRYSDTAGDNSDFPIPQMYLYRNWVIDAFNRDMPYDQFVREQLAGDLMPSLSLHQRNQQLIATGYLANARRFGSRVDDYPVHLTIEDTIDNLGRAFLGQTLNCARCHDHKFDPISTDDYYGLYGFFSSTRYPWPGIELEQKQRDLVPLVPVDEASQKIAAHQARQNELDAEVRRLEKRPEPANDVDKKPFKKEIEEARKKAERHGKTLPDIPFAYAVNDGAKIDDVPVQYKGNPERTGDLIRRRFPSILGEQTLPVDDKTSGRLALANWIVDPGNPLTSRVIVNRIWLYHFGQGLVTTPNDFGRQGKPPSHPGLLDWLASRFIQSNWSIKSMHRLMMKSRAYQSQSVSDASLIVGDPSNDFLSGFRRQRLNAETIRDTLLVLGGNLDTSASGPHPFPPSSEWKYTQHNPFKAIYDTDHRSVYLMTQRIQRHPFLAIFDGPDTSVSTPQRGSSTTPLQSLYFMNSPFVHRQAERLANRIIRERSDDAGRIDGAYQLLFSRHPRESESRSSLSYLANVVSLLKQNGTPIEQTDSLSWQSYVRSLLLLNEFVYVD